MIKDLKLLESGTEVLLTTVDGKSKLVRIEHISKPDKSAVGAAMMMYKQAGLTYIPLKIGNRVYLLDRDGDFYEEELVRAVSNGVNIDTSKYPSDDEEQKSKDDENIIDI